MTETIKRKNGVLVKPASSKTTFDEWKACAVPGDVDDLYDAKYSSHKEFSYGSVNIKEKIEKLDLELPLKLKELDFKIGTTPIGKEAVEKFTESIYAEKKEIEDRSKILNDDISLQCSLHNKIRLMEKIDIILVLGSESLKFLV